MRVGPRSEHLLLQLARPSKKSAYLGWIRHTHNQKFIRVMSVEHGGHEILQPRPITLSSPMVVNRNRFTGLTLSGGGHSA
ncbi:hypothetical protein TNCV_4033651 [Trichonephila clavipes]|nr:hypothetical protein TNCV_4033651 [Trichonephila clavipes]